MTCEKWFDQKLLKRFWDGRNFSGKKIRTYSKSPKSAAIDM